MRFKQTNPRKRKSSKMKYSHDALTNAYKQCIENNMPVRRSAKLFNVPRTTLRDRLSGRVQIDTITTKLPLFTMLEEAKLVDHLKTMANYRYGYTRQETVNLASDLADQLGKRKKEDPLSLKWIRGFLQRWPELRVVKPRGLEYSRAKMTSTKIVDAYFENLQQCLIKHSLTDKPHLIFNLDEKGVTTEHRPPHIIGSSSHCPPAVTSGRGKTVTILGCISASGMAIPPFFVFPGKRMNHELLIGKSPGADGDVSDSGWSNHAIFRRYLTDHFINYIPGRGDQKVLLMLDGHKSHVSVGLCEWARENGIIFFFLPPHTSHLLQPLDVLCYGPFERMFNAECHKMMRQTASVLNRFNVCEISCKVYSKALSPDNAQSAFRRTGIYPLNKSIIPSESLLPAEVYQTSQNDEVETDDSQATVEGGIPADTSVEPDEEVTDIFEMFSTKEANLKRIKSETVKKPRRTMSKIVAGREVTEEVISRMKDHENMFKRTETTSITKKSKSVGKTCNKKTKVGYTKKKRKAVDIKKTKTKLNSDISCTVEKPGPSCVNLLSDSSISDSESNATQTECCVCNKIQPKELADCTSLFFVKWAQCDGMNNGFPCLHWVHLKYCTSESY